MKLRSSPKACHFQNPIRGSHTLTLAPELQQACLCPQLHSLFTRFWVYSPKSANTTFPQPTDILALKQFALKICLFLSPLGWQTGKKIWISNATHSSWAGIPNLKRQDRAGDIQPFVTTKQKSAKSSMFDGKKCHPEENLEAIKTSLKIGSLEEQVKRRGRLRLWTHSCFSMRQPSLYSSSSAMGDDNL